MDNNEKISPVKCDCGEEKNFKINRVSKGEVHCTCKSCGKEFVVQLGESYIISRYIAERSEVFSAIETAALENRKIYGADTKLSGLSEAYPELTETDAVYYWYRIALITENFKNIDKFREAKKMYRKISDSKRYFLTESDRTRSAQYEKDYEEYEKEYWRRFKKKILIALTFVFIFLAACIAALTTVSVYQPTFTDAETGIRIKIDNGAYGLIEKFYASVQAEEIPEGSLEYGIANTSLEEGYAQFKVYRISLLKRGSEKQPDKDVEVSIPLPSGFRKENIEIFLIYGDGSREEITDGFNTLNNTVNFRTKSFGIFAIAEKAYTVTFDSAGGSTVETCKVKWGDTVSEPAVPTKTGYFFVGWYMNGALYDFSSTVSQNVSLVAHWTARTYTISYYIDNALYKTQQVDYASEYSLMQSVREGYAVEWYENGIKQTGGIWDRTDDIILHARFVALTYKVTFIHGVDECCDAVSSGTSELTVTYGENAANITVPHKTGYVFDGYYTLPDGGGVRYYSALGECTGEWHEPNDTMLYAKWLKDSEYGGYTYIESYEDLTYLYGNTQGKYLLICDLNLNGAVWTPVADFKGTFDGGNHTIYNFKITGGIASDTNLYAFGFFAELKNTATVANLQIGKYNYSTSIATSGEGFQKKYNAGMIAGYSSGKIVNCRIENCSIVATVKGQGAEYTGQEFYDNTGGICGVVRGGSISRCSVTGLEIQSEAKAAWDHIRPMARAGGIAGYADNSTVTDCIIKNCSLSSHGLTVDSAIGNWAGSPYARTGSAVGEAVNSVFQRCIESGNTVNAKIDWVQWTDSGGNSYSGSMLGSSSGCAVSNMVAVNPAFNCSGSDSSLGLIKISADNFYSLINVTSAFNNGYWKSDDGKIALDYSIVS